MTSNSIWATFTINGLFFVSIMFLFERYRVRVLDLYAPNSRGNNPKFALPRTGYFEWIKQLYEIPDDQMFAIAGMDGYMFLRFLMFCCKLVTICAVPCAFILIPVYATSPSSEYVNGFEIASMANVNHSGDRLWAPFVFAYLFTFVFLYLIHKEYENFIVMRKKYFHGAFDIVPLQTKYTVQVENIPDEFRNSQKLYEAFDSLFSGDVLYAHVIVDTPELDKLVAERNAVRDKLEKEIAVFEGNGRKNRPLIDMAKLSPRRYSSGHEVDSITYLTRRLHKLCSRTARLQRAIIIDQHEPEEMPESPRPVVPPTDPIIDADPRVERSSPTYSEDSDESDDEGDPEGIEGIEMNPVYNPLTSTSAPSSPKKRKFSDVLMDVRNRISEHFISTTGFVTFKTRRATITAVKTTILLEQYPYMTAAQAPPPVDVIWENLSASTMVTEETAFFSAGLYYGSLAFWGGVMAFVAAISTASSLQHYLPFLRKLDYIAYSVVEGLLPVVVVLSFSALVSGAIAFVAQKVEQRKTNSAVEREVFRW